MHNTNYLALTFIEQRIAALESFSGESGAVEGFAILRQLENLLFRVVANFKLNLTKGFKDFKRSELRAYQESHRGDMRMLFNQKKWVTLNAVSIPVPKALHRSYLSAATQVATSLRDAHYKEAITLMTAAIAAAWDSKADTPAQTVDIACDNMTKLWGSQGYVPEVTELAPYLTLADRGQVEFPARDVFADLASVEQTATAILEFEPYFTDAVIEQTSLTSLEKTVDGMVNILEKTTKVPIAYLNSLHRLIATFVKFLDTYAQFLQAAQLLEHCFVLSLQRLVHAR